MSIGRPSPLRLAHRYTERHGIVEEVYSTPAIYTVTYRGDPVGIRENTEAGGWSYTRSCFPTRAAAHLLARKLNKRFDCRDFGVAIFESFRTEPAEPR